MLCRPAPARTLKASSSFLQKGLSISVYPLIYSTHYLSIPISSLRSSNHFLHHMFPSLSCSSLSTPPHFKKLQETRQIGRVNSFKISKKRNCSKGFGFIENLEQAPLLT
jgi:hypothetical protein